VLWTCGQDGDGLLKEKTSEGHEVQTSQSSGQPLVVIYQPPKLRCPREKIAFHDSAAWQEHEATFGLRVLDHLQTNAVSLRLFRWPLPSVALIHDVGQIHRIRRSLVAQPRPTLPPKLALVHWPE
jgi:hypothetical protein